MADTGGEVNPPKKLVVDNREEKVKLVREKQAEERQKRLEELKKNALEAQQLREQKETERRKRMEDLRQKENDRRSQVEERKKLIWEAERERREAIVRKNQEREARIDAKRRNERSSIVFAFGSSTPRLMDTYDSGCFMVPRRATSTANLRLFPNQAAMSQSMVAPSLPRRSSEREMEPKKRACSAGGLYRAPGDQMSTSMYEVFHWEADPAKPRLSRLSLAPNSDLSLSTTAPPTPLRQSHPHPLPSTARGGAAEATLDDGAMVRVGRRKTDLMPTLPSPREGASRPGSGTRSLARTPGDLTPSRPGSVLSQYSLCSASTARLRSTPRRPRPFSIHVTGVSKDKEKISSPSEEKPKAKENKEANEKVKENKVKPKESNKVREGKEERVSKPPTPKAAVTKKQIQQKNEEIKRSQPKRTENSKNIVENNNVVDVNGTDGEAVERVKESLVVEDAKVVELVEAREETEPQAELTVTQEVVNDLVDLAVETPSEEKVQADEAAEETKPDEETQEAEDEGKGNVMSRSKITTEEEAKAALAERRRLAREQAEREAEAERLRLEQEAQLEAERIRKEEEEQRLAEEEQLRLLEEARKMEETRLMEAIQETQKREEEERERRRLEEQARVEKEEAERKAREEAERQRVEMAERLKREEEERTARRKRVEAIMKRTRTTPANASGKAECEKGEEDGAEHEKDESKGSLEAFLHGERVCTDKTLTNGQSSNELHRTETDNMNGSNQMNGLIDITSSGLENEDCLNSNANPAMETPLIAFQGKTKDTPLAANYMA